MPAAKAPVDERFVRLREHMRAQRLKSTAQRDLIAATFFDTQRHISVEEIYNEVRKRNPRIGYATVYRTMKLLAECGLAIERHFREGEARYESAEKSHHDHLICENCGKIVEFEEPRIEALQRSVAKRRDFHLTGHKMELYGICTNCAKIRRRQGS